MSLPKQTASSAATDLTPRQRQSLRQRAHDLHPLVTVAGKGLTETVLAEIDRALTDHELIKIRVLSDRGERAEIIATVCTAMTAQLVQQIGKVGVLYRPNPKGKPRLSNLKEPTR